MGTIESVQLKFIENDELRNILAWIGEDRIVLREQDEQDMEIALMDLDGDRELDTIAIDLFGQGDFPLYVVDADMDGVPDTAYYEIAETGLLEQLDVCYVPEETLEAWNLDRILKNVNTPEDLAELTGEML